MAFFCSARGYKVARSASFCAMELGTKKMRLMYKGGFGGGKKQGRRGGSWARRAVWAGGARWMREAEEEESHLVFFTGMELVDE